MRLRRGNGNGEEAAPQAPPPSAADRVEEPTSVLPPSGADAAPPAGAGGTPEPAGAGGTPEPSGAGAAPPSATDRVDAPPPSAGERVAEPAAPTAADRVDAPPPSASDLVAPAQPAPAPAALACPSCGTPAQPGQELCVACGARIARAYHRPPASRLPLVLAVIGVLLLGAGVGYAGYALLSDDEVSKDEAEKASVATKPTTTPNPVPLTGPTGPSGPSGPSGASGPSGVSGPSGTSGPTIPPATREAPSTPSPTPSTGATPASWPAGKTAHTVVLVSAKSRSSADSKARQAVGRGVPAGVLHSDDYSSLRPGYWVVFAGQFDSSEEARKAADRYAEQGFSGGYPRLVKPK
ncbi:MAG TPA: SPOR domain-containing protein [Thermoleophilaceae bacterium]